MIKILFGRRSHVGYKNTVRKNITQSTRSSVRFYALSHFRLAIMLSTELKELENASRIIYCLNHGISST